MSEVSNALIQLINAQVQYYEYLEANGNDGSETYQQLLTNRNAAQATHEEKLTEFVDARIAAP